MTNSGRSDLDPGLKQLLKAAPITFDFAGDGVERSRARFNKASASGVAVSPGVDSTDHSFVGSTGNRLSVRVYRPHTLELSAGAPVVLFCHGGGFVLGDLDSYDGFCRRHATGAEAIVVAVDYRLAPEHPYPAAVDDTQEALRWIRQHADEIGADITRLAVAGDSAGGNLAAVATQIARTHSDPAVRFQLLWYPLTTCDLNSPSMTENADAPILGLSACQTLLSWYAPGVDLGNPPPTLAPAFAPSLDGLPPAFIATAGHDPLRDDGFRYAELLSAAGVPVQHHHAPSLIHGYAYFDGVLPAATQAVDRGLAALRAALHN
ncbi:alpha/beta hydrolase [Mycolicibacterium austroafricanum]|uniref:alpha/beta hydrolase n=1 Tax=Mycolicibacterium austroafricanum TaxID=39687 RepID=UPI00056150D7|nr:alpha/beta hydrolase [Mycolicibacterium austroafricanum]